MKIDLYLIAAHIFVFTSCLSINYFECVRKYDHIIPDAYACGIPNNSYINDTLLRLPEYLPNLTKYLDIHGYVENVHLFEKRLPVQIDDINMFKRMPLLQFLTITASKLEILDELYLLVDQLEVLKTELFNLNNLKNLIISVVEPTFEPNANNQWVLPKNLINFGVEGALEEYDLRGCFKLQRLSVHLCNCTKLPPLHIPAPPIRLLHFHGCPLNELTVDDIAMFCLLDALSITSLEAPYNVSIEECECIRLQQWIDQFTKWDLLDFHGKLPCAEPNFTSTKSCMNCSLSNAMRLRKECLGKGGFVILCVGIAIMLQPIVFVCVATIRWYRKMYGDQPPAPSSADSTVGSERESDSY